MTARRLRGINIDRPVFTVLQRVPTPLHVECGLTASVIQKNLTDV